MMLSSSSDSEHSKTGLQRGPEKSSEDSDSELETIQQRKNNKKACKKRKRMKKVVSGSEDSSEIEGTEQVIRASKKRRKKNSDHTPDHNKLKRKGHISSDDETEEKSPVTGNSLTADISSGAETEKRESPVKGNRTSGNRAKASDSDDDSSTNQDMPVKIEKERESGNEKQVITENEEDSPSHSPRRLSNSSSREKCGSKQKLRTVQHSSDSSDGTSDTDEKTKLYQSKNDGSCSSESSTLPGISETAKTVELKSYGKEVENKAEKKTVKEESRSSDEPLSKYSDKQKSTKKNLEHSSSGSSDSASDTDEKKCSLSPKKKSQRDGDSSSESSTPPDIVDKKKKRKSDWKKVKNKTQKDPGNAEKTNPKIERLKKYLRVAGLRVRSYQKLWEGCKTNKAKIEKLLQMLSDAGLQGKPTLQKCKRLQAKRERKEEVASLDVGNIIVTSEKGRPKRSTPSLYLSRHIVDAKGNSLRGKGDNNTFSRIKNLVDSEESE